MPVCDDLHSMNSNSCAELVLPISYYMWLVRRLLHGLCVRRADSAAGVAGGCQDQVTSHWSRHFGPRKLWFQDISAPVDDN